MSAMRLAPAVAIFALVVGLAPTCSRAEDTAAGPERPPVLATLERTACYGSCPVYSLTIYADGKVEYEGKLFVKVVGPGSSKLDAKELEALRAAFAEAKFFELDSNYTCQSRTDASSAHVSYRLGNNAKRIDHYHGCNKAPPALSRLEERLDELTRSAQWIGSREERRKPLTP
jgi:hypothetical protein